MRENLFIGRLLQKMRTTFISFNLKSISGYLERISVFDEDYEKTYRPLGKFLYANPDFPFSLSLTGRQAAYLKRDKGEFGSILRGMVDRNQVELLGGGLVSPVFPLITSTDICNQIEYFSTCLRKLFGKRPRGMALNPDIWSSSLVNNIYSCNVHYLYLEGSLIPEEKQLFIPIIMSEGGKSINIYPYYPELNPTADMTPQTFLDNIIDAVEKAEARTDFGPLNESEYSHIVNINIDHILMGELSKVSWFDKFYKFFKNTKDPKYQKLKLTTTLSYDSDCTIKVPAYIHSGVPDYISKYCGKPYVINEGFRQKRNTVFDFLETYYLNKALYCRLVYVTMLINQYKENQRRKILARDILSRGQSGNGFIWIEDCASENIRARQQTYQYYMEAENMLRGDHLFKPAVTSYDYNKDCIEEYICRMLYFFSYVSILGGVILHVEPVHLSGNYSDNLSRMKLFDDIEDNYRRGFFVDHFFDDKQFDDYVNVRDFGGSIFAGKFYKEVERDFINYTFKIGVDSETSTGQKVYLAKKFVFDKDCITVDYEFTNKSDSVLTGKLASECNFACFDPVEDNDYFYSFHVTVDGQIIKSNDNCKDNIIENISKLRVIDPRYENVFIFTPREKCNFVYNTIHFNRPDRVYKITPVQYDFVSTLYWDVNLKPGETFKRSIHLLINDDANKKQGVINPKSGSLANVSFPASERYDYVF